MNKQELEKLFDEKVTNMRIFDEYKNDITYKVKQFIFETVIPEVLKDIENEYWNFFDWCWCCANLRLDEELNQRAKELYNINL